MPQLFSCTDKLINVK